MNKTGTRKKKLPVCDHQGCSNTLVWKHAQCTRHYPNYLKKRYETKCRYHHCKNIIQDGDWMCNKHKSTEYIWKEKCLNCGDYHIIK